MEILDDGRGRPARHPDPVAERPRASAVNLDLDPGSHGAPAPNQARDQANPDRALPDDGRSRAHRALGALLSSEALGGAGLFVVAATMMSPAQVGYFPYFASTEPMSPAEMMTEALQPYLLGALACVALGVLALFRLPERASHAARGLAGAAVIAGALLLIRTAQQLSQASALTEQIPQG